MEDQGKVRGEGRAARRIAGRITYSNVVATLALFLALGGGIAWALERNEVKSKHIKNGQVKGVDVKADTLKGGDIDEETLDLNVVARNVVSADSAAPQDTATCDPGERAVGGGASLSTTGAVLRISRPSPNTEGATPTGWTAASSHPSATSHPISVWVLCATP